MTRAGDEWEEVRASILRELLIKEHIWGGVHYPCANCALERRKPGKHRKHWCLGARDSANVSVSCDCECRRISGKFVPPSMRLD